MTWLRLRYASHGLPVGRIPSSGVPAFGFRFSGFFRILFLGFQPSFHSPPLPLLPPVKVPPLLLFLSFCLSKISSRLLAKPLALVYLEFIQQERCDRSPWSRVPDFLRSLDVGPRARSSACNRSLFDNLTQQQGWRASVAQPLDGRLESAIHES